MRLHLLPLFLHALLLPLALPAAAPPPPALSVTGPAELAATLVLDDLVIVVPPTTAAASTVALVEARVAILDPSPLACRLSLPAAATARLRVFVAPSPVRHARLALVGDLEAVNAALRTVRLDDACGGGLGRIGALPSVPARVAVSARLFNSGGDEGGDNGAATAAATAAAAGGSSGGEWQSTLVVAVPSLPHLYDAGDDDIGIRDSNRAPMAPRLALRRSPPLARFEGRDAGSPFSAAEALPDAYASGALGLTDAGLTLLCAEDRACPLSAFAAALRIENARTGGDASSRLAEAAPLRVSVVSGGAGAVVCEDESGRAGVSQPRLSIVSLGRCAFTAPPDWSGATALRVGLDARLLDDGTDGAGEFESSFFPRPLLVEVLVLPVPDPPHLVAPPFTLLGTEDVPARLAGPEGAPNTTAGPSAALFIAGGDGDTLELSVQATNGSLILPAGAAARGLIAVRAVASPAGPLAAAACNAAATGPTVGVAPNASAAAFLISGGCAASFVVRGTASRLNSALAALVFVGPLDTWGPASATLSVARFVPGRSAKNTSEPNDNTEDASADNRLELGPSSNASTAVVRLWLAPVNDAPRISLPGLVSFGSAPSSGPDDASAPATVPLLSAVQGERLDLLRLALRIVDPDLLDSPPAQCGQHASAQQRLVTGGPDTLGFVRARVEARLAGGRVSLRPEALSYWCNVTSSGGATRSGAAAAAALGAPPVHFVTRERFIEVEGPVVDVQDALHALSYTYVGGRARRKKGKVERRDRAERPDPAVAAGGTLRDTVTITVADLGASGCTFRGGVATRAGADDVSALPIRPDAEAASSVSVEIAVLPAADVPALLCHSGGVALPAAPERADEGDSERERPDGGAGASIEGGACPASLVLQRRHARALPRGYDAAATANPSTNADADAVADAGASRPQALVLAALRPRPLPLLLLHEPSMRFFPLGLGDVALELPGAPRLQLALALSSAQDAAAAEASPKPLPRGVGLVARGMGAAATLEANLTLLQARRALASLAVTLPSASGVDGNGGGYVSEARAQAFVLSVRVSVAPPASAAAASSAPPASSAVSVTLWLPRLALPPAHMSLGLPASHASYFRLDAGATALPLSWLRLMPRSLDAASAPVGDDGGDALEAIAASAADARLATLVLTSFMGRVALPRPALARARARGVAPLLASGSFVPPHLRPLVALLSPSAPAPAPAPVPEPAPSSASSASAFPSSSASSSSPSSFALPPAGEEGGDEGGDGEGSFGDKDIAALGARCLLPFRALAAARALAPSSAAAIAAAEAAAALASASPRGKALDLLTALDLASSSPYHSSSDAEVEATAARGAGHLQRACVVALRGSVGALNALLAFGFSPSSDDGSARVLPAAANATGDAPGVAYRPAANASGRDWLVAFLFVDGEDADPDANADASDGQGHGSILPSYSEFLPSYSSKVFAIDVAAPRSQPAPPAPPASAPSSSAPANEDETAAADADAPRQPAASPRFTVRGVAFSRARARSELAPNRNSFVAGPETADGAEADVEADAEAEAESWACLAAPPSLDYDAGLGAVTALPLFTYPRAYAREDAGAAAPLMYVRAQRLLSSFAPPLLFPCKSTAEGSASPAPARASAMPHTRFVLEHSLLPAFSRTRVLPLPMRCTEDVPCRPLPLSLSLALSGAAAERKGDGPDGGPGGDGDASGDEGGPLLQLTLAVARGALLLPALVPGLARIVGAPSPTHDRPLSHASQAAPDDGDDGTSALWPAHAQAHASLSLPQDARDAPAILGPPPLSPPLRGPWRRVTLQGSADALDTVLSTAAYVGARHWHSRSSSGAAGEELELDVVAATAVALDGACVGDRGATPQDALPPRRVCAAAQVLLPVSVAAVPDAPSLRLPPPFAVVAGTVPPLLLPLPSRGGDEGEGRASWLASGVAAQALVRVRAQPVLRLSVPALFLDPDGDEADPTQQLRAFLAVEPPELAPGLRLRARLRLPLRLGLVVTRCESLVTAVAAAEAGAGAAFDLVDRDATGAATPSASCEGRLAVEGTRAALAASLALLRLDLPMRLPLSAQPASLAVSLEVALALPDGAVSVEALAAASTSVLLLPGLALPPCLALQSADAAGAWRPATLALRLHLPAAALPPDDAEVIAADFPSLAPEPRPVAAALGLVLSGLGPSPALRSALVALIPSLAGEAAAHMLVIVAARSVHGSLTLLPFETASAGTDAGADADTALACALGLESSSAFFDGHQREREGATATVDARPLRRLFAAHPLRPSCGDAPSVFVDPLVLGPATEGARAVFVAGPAEAVAALLSRLVYTHPFRAADFVGPRTAAAAAQPTLLTPGMRHTLAAAREQRGAWALANAPDGPSPWLDQQADEGPEPSALLSGDESEEVLLGLAPALDELLTLSLVLSETPQPVPAVDSALDSASTEAISALATARLAAVASASVTLSGVSMQVLAHVGAPPPSPSAAAEDDAEGAAESRRRKLEKWESGLRVEL